MRKKASTKKEHYGMELILDLHQCDPKIIRSKRKLSQYINQLCKKIKMKKYGPSIIEHFGYSQEKTKGYSLVQLIETSSIVGHFSEKWNSAYLNIFSCKDFDPKSAAKFSQEFFKAKKMKMKFLKRI